MNVIGHQHVAVNDTSISLAIVFESLKIVEPIPIVAKDLLALIASDDDVIERPSNSTRGFLAMSRGAIAIRPNKSRLRPDPITIYRSGDLRTTCTLIVATKLQ
jgi:hypothetical protein